MFTDRRVSIRSRGAASAKRGGHLSPVVFGEAVAAEEGLSTAYSKAIVTEWMGGTAVPSFAAFMAMAAVAGYTSGYQMGWIAYGNEHQLHALDESDYNRFHSPA
jgi:hypothetical protein